MGNFLDSVTQRSNDSLVTLFQLRPDLANPSPTHLASLAARVSNSSSIARALASLNAQTLQVLEAVLLLHSLGQPTSATSVVFAVSGEHYVDTANVDTANVDTASATPEVVSILDNLGMLRDYALLWTESEDAITQSTVFHAVPGVELTMDRFPAGFGPLSHNTVSTSPLPPQAPQHAQSVINALLWGPPIAVVPTNLLSVRPAAHEPATNESLRWLLRNGYLELLDESHVYLPRQTAFALRGGRTHQGVSQPPLSSVTGSLTDQAIGAEAALHAQESVRLVSELVTLWEHTPASALRNGGLPVRELKRVAQELEIDSDTAVMVCEVAYAAQLVRAGDDLTKDFAPTQRVDAWLAADLAGRWSQLVQGVIASSRAPWRVGQLDDKAATINALHPQIHAPWIPRLKASILTVLAQHKGVPLTAQLVAAQLAWFAPRATASADAVAGILAQLEFLGLTGSGALLPQADTGDLAQALESALPIPVNELFIQSDLTGMVLGRPGSALESLLEVSAVVESRGSALTVRFTPESITRAFDSGMGATELVELLQSVSVTPIPQPLSYLIADVARKHGNIRVGVASTYVRLPDEISAAAVRSLGARGQVQFFDIAPCVLGSTASISSVLAVLREAGLAPAVEGPDGQIVTADRQTPRARVATRPARVSMEQHTGVATTFAGERAIEQLVAGHRAGQVRAQPSEHLVNLVDLIRSASSPTGSAQPAGSVQLVGSAHRVATHGSEHGTGGPDSRAQRNEIGQPSVEAVAPETSTHGATQPTKPDEETSVVVVNLREAIAHNLLVTLALADGKGTLHHRTVRPITLEQGRLRALDPARESELTVAIHRIATVNPA